MARTTPDGSPSPAGSDGEAQPDEKPARQQRRKRHTPQSELDRQRGRKFAAWLNAGIDKRSRDEKESWTDKRLSDETKKFDPNGKGVSPQWIGILRKDGVNAQTLDVQRASERYIAMLAKALGIDENAGLEAAGYERRTPRKPGQIVLESGEVYTMVANPLGIELELEITPELIQQLEIYAELQKLRRKCSQVR